MARNEDLLAVIRPFVAGQKPNLNASRKLNGLLFAFGTYISSPFSNKLRTRILLCKQIDENVQREIINHRSLRHPNIVRFKEVCFLYCDDHE